MVMFGLASIIVGIVFYSLGKFRLGRIIYFFPSHVLLGCIGGIGLFIAKTGIEVTIAEGFSIEAAGEKWILLSMVIIFEVILRMLQKATEDKEGKSKYTLLAPIYFCLITPIFYLILATLQVSIQDAEDAGFFFPSLDSDDSESSSIDRMGHVHFWDMFTIIEFSTVSWTAIYHCIPTLVALTMFSLIHVPINIPAFAQSAQQEADMNRELVAHGYSNIIAGMFGGLQNYMAYTQSILYHKSGGTGRESGIAVAIVTSLTFFVGPAIGSYIPRCMAGTLLLHVGIDLFLEGVYDSYGGFDNLEYSGIWLIVVIMTLYGMEAAMIAGIIAAVSTYAVQSVAYLSPIRGHMPATTLRSSQMNRNPAAQNILNSDQGRSRILVIQLQGHLFFGNMAHFTENMHQLLQEKTGVTGCSESDSLAPFIIIVDFSLVLSIDSSAAQAIAKLKQSLLSKHCIELCVFVTGSVEGFPTEFDLSDKLSDGSSNLPTIQEEGVHSDHVTEETALLMINYKSVGDSKAKVAYSGSHVCDSLDLALIFAENALISRNDPSLLYEDDVFENLDGHLTPKLVSQTARMPLEAERALAISLLQNLCHVVQEGDSEILFSLFEREVYKRKDLIWKQHSVSDSAKLLVFGTLIAELENEAGTTETVSKGNLVGEVGLVRGEARMSSLKCLSETAIVYSLSRESYESLVRKEPRIARYIDQICIKYLYHRVQHVSNRIFETRCLPI
jgi:SulP family sulfate permease